MASYDTNAISVLVESTLAAHDGCCLDDQRDRRALRMALTEVIAEFCYAPVRREMRLDSLVGMREVAPEGQPGGTR